MENRRGWSVSKPVGNQKESKQTCGESKKIAVSARKFQGVIPPKKKNFCVLCLKLANFFMSTPPICTPLVLGSTAGATICVLGGCQWRTISTRSLDLTQQLKSRCSALFGAQGWGLSKLFWTPYHKHFLTAQRFPDECYIVWRR